MKTTTGIVLFSLFVVVVTLMASTTAVDGSNALKREWQLRHEETSTRLRYVTKENEKLRTELDDAFNQAHYNGRCSVWNHLEEKGLGKFTPGKDSYGFVWDVEQFGAGQVTFGFRSHVAPPHAPPPGKDGGT